MVDVDERAKELQREYLREWRKRNKEKMRVYRENYWLKKHNRKGEKIEMKPFQKIADAAKSTGLSQYFLRKGCRDGSIPCIKSGTTFYVNVPALLAQLGAVGAGG